MLGNFLDRRRPPPHDPRPSAASCWSCWTSSSQCFEPGLRYPESRVNEILGEFHPDYAALRRYLVENGFLDRADNHYWRSGGTFDV